MPVTFARIRIAGFKSFAEPVSVEILPGLTGIVGPNGCGKSNVVEALRWCMGESSARSLRGGEMDDLIFAGTVGRAARNLADVVLTLEDAAGLAPPPLHEQAELQISRRIERGAGSSYRINGREARARDVQTLFADLASGARSSAMVSQGRVAAIVGARPEERRSVLEEAAGITGLHARRHEAELKLRATEANLVRAEDLRQQLATQTRSLSGQAEQAARYRVMAEELRAKESALLALLHARARRAVELAGTARLEAGQARIAAEAALATAAADEQRAAGALAAPREAEALARTLLERRRIECEGAVREGERALQESDAADRRLAQAREDCEAAEHREVDAAREVERLGTEHAALAEAWASLPERVSAAEQALETARSAIEATEHAHRTAASTAAAAATRHAEHRRDTEAADARLARATMLLREIQAAKSEAEALLPDADTRGARDRALEVTQATLVETERVLDAAIAARADTAREAEAARLAAEDARRRYEAARGNETAAAGRLARLRDERTTLETRLAEAERNLVPVEQRQAARAAVADGENSLAKAADALAATETARQDAAAARMDRQNHSRDGARARAQAETERSRTAAAHARAVIERAQAVREHEAVLAASLPETALATAEAARVEADTALLIVSAALDADEAAHDAAQAETTRCAETLAVARETAARLTAETDGLAQALAAGRDQDAVAFETLEETLNVPAGLELAVAAVLADGLEAALAVEAPQSWLALPPLPEQALPGGAVPLASLIAAPEQLRRALAHAGLVDDEAATVLHASLHPGQSLVTSGGALWRWDGLRIRAGQPSRASIRLQLRARHRHASAALEQADAAIAPAERDLEAAQATRARLAARLQTLRMERTAAQQALSRAQAEENRLLQADAQNRARLDAIAPRRARADGSLAEAETAHAAARAVLAALPMGEVLEREAAEAVRVETVAVSEEQAQRRARAEADSALQQARAREASLNGRHAMHETAQRGLLPALERARADEAAAASAFEEARAALGDAAPDAAVKAAETTGAAARLAVETESSARTARDAARTALAQQQLERDRIAAVMRDGAARITALEERRGAATAEHDAARSVVASLLAVTRGLPDAEAAALAAADADKRLAETRDHERTAAAEEAALRNVLASLAERQGPLDAARLDWMRRLQTARVAAEEARERLLAARTEAEKRRLDPDGEAARRASIDAALERAETEHAAAWERLSRAEDTVGNAQNRRRDAEGALNSARETLLRAEGREEQAREILLRLLAETPEPPDTVPADLSDSAETSLRRRIATLLREREAMGPVNLRAELELNEAAARMAAIMREGEEIETAISRLRGQIGQLNREGRERLVAVFEAVDRHFQSLFARMFNGGRAHLGMVGSDDPLEAGLEIYAQPPGKKLATLSLLSGGEQALTALSLVFAVFRCNPAPICVLDEVDAPLDDANVERFCTLLGDMVREAGTRFLVVTHHQLTMAHMDRLYGVTMQERGVSRVLSVDLAAAASMIH